LLGCYTFGLDGRLYATEIFALLGYYTALIRIYVGESNENLKFVIKKSKFRAIIL